MVIATGSFLQQALEDSLSNLRRVEDVPAALASHLLLELGRKPVMRELHHVDRVEEAAERWHSLGFVTCRGEEISEDQVTYALLSKENATYTVRPLARHPVIERAVDLGGPLAERVLLDKRSPLYRLLARRFEADEEPVHAQVDYDDSERVKQRCTLYVSKDLKLAQTTRNLDRMAGGSHEDHTAELGDALGYPRCCVKAYASLERRWPNRLPIAAAAGRTQHFHPRLNNLCLKRFNWIGYFPCRFDCEPSLELAHAAAEMLERLNPELVRAIDALLALPRIYWHDDKQAVLLGAKRSGREITFDEAPSLASLWPHPGRAQEEITELEGARRLRLQERPQFYGASGKITLKTTPLVLPFMPGS
jgi:hypothetical protein